MNKGKGKRVVVLFLVLSFVTLSGRLIAEERKGAEVKVLEKNRDRVDGELIAVKQNSILVKSVSGEDVSINISDIRFIETQKHPRVLDGGVAGILAGVFVGYAIGSANDPPGFLHGIETAQGVGIGALAGGLLGVMIGSQIKASERFQFEGKSPEEVKAVLEKLRSKARVPDFQGHN